MAKQEEHTAEECKINEQPNLSPEDDCGHYVDSGPGVGVEKYAGNDGVVQSGFTPDSAKGKEQDPKHGPGV